VVVGGDGTKVRVRKLVVGNIRTIDLKLQLVSGVHDVQVRPTLRGDQALDRVVEVQLLNLTTGRQGLLHLVDDDLLRLGREMFTLLGVDVRKVGKAIPLVRVRGRTPRDAQLHIVVGEGHQRKNVLPALTEEESERVETGGVAVVILVNTTETRLGEALRQHLRSNVRREQRVLGINNLTTNQKLDLVDDRRPVDDGAVGFRTRALDGLEVHIAQQITLSFHTDSGHTPIADVPLDNLALDRLGKVRVTLVRTAEIADFGIADEMGILLANGHELGDSTRHLLYYYKRIKFLST